MKNHEEERVESVYICVCLCHVQITCSECVRNGQMIVTGGSGGVVSFWSIQNSMQVCMMTSGYYIYNKVATMCSGYISL